MLVARLRSAPKTPLLEVAARVVARTLGPHVRLIPQAQPFGNLVVLAETTTSAYYVKIYDPRLPADHAHAEAQAIRTASTAGVPTPRIVSHGVLSVDATRFGFMITAPVAGVSIETLPRLSPVLLKQMSQQIEHLNAVTSDTYGVSSSYRKYYAKSSTYGAYLDDIVQRAFMKLSETRTCVADWREAYEESASNPTMGSYVYSHRELRARHILVTNDHAVCLIDWEWAQFLEPGYDCATMLASLLIDRPDWDAFTHLKQRFVTRYDWQRLSFLVGREILISTAWQRSRRAISDDIVHNRRAVTISLLRKRELLRPPNPAALR